MSNGRNSSVIRSRIPDEVLARLKERANQQGIGYTVLVRQMIEEKLGLKKT
jgi:predicted DNA binding CopG/RHH family protein